MKRFLIIAVLLGCVLPASAQWRRQPTPNDTLQSVRVLPDGKVLFQLYAPEAGSVAVTGDLPWNKPVKFEKNKDGVWQGICEGLEDGCFRYSFIVDGVRVQDPKAPLSAEQASVFTKGAGYIKDVPHGAVAQRWYWSSTLKCMRRMHVWTPAGYEKSGKKLPVLYLIHGGGDNDASWPGVGAAGWILDNMLAEGKMVPMIVVMPNGTIETDDMMGEVPLFGEDMVKSIIPFIEANYRVKSGQKHRAMAGLSMGGMETIETAFLHPELFSHVWVLSSSFSPGKQKEYIERIHLNDIAPALNKNFKALVFTQGGPEDIAYNNCKEALGYLKEAGVRYDYQENAQAGHSWITWRADLAKLAPTLFR
ncbi:MAG: endo-1,4-beta-xylanase Z [Bacteroidales bacterium]|nr:endo-1,4-beta-xylanase Z [Bacteroidales bacterium]